MVFNSLYFLLLFPFLLLFYYLMPQRGKNGFLLVISLLFYGSFHFKYVFLLLAVIIVGYYSGILLEKSKERRKKQILFLNGAAIVILLAFYKYLNFLWELITGIFSFRNPSDMTPVVSMIVPVGISFYTLLSLGYVIDVYRGKVKAEKSFVDYGAFVSFFPPLLSGPIERADNLLVQIKQKKIFSEELIRQGFGRMLWGYFQKVMIADRIAVPVTAVYENYQNYTGIYVLATTLLYAFQIYCDFSGYSNLAIGASNMLGFRLGENFCTPYFSTDISEFWRRWHISLSSWFRDYIYIPLGGNRKGKGIKYRNLLITFLISGLWHGASLTFVFWGLLHGIYQIIFDGILPRWKEWQGRAATVVKMAVTFLLVDFAWLFFRADSLKTALGLLEKIIFDFQPLSILDRQLAITMGMEISDFAVLAASLVILVLAEIASCHWNVRKSLDRLPLVLRWSCYYIFIFIILIFGYYGPGFDLGQFIYAQF